MKISTACALALAALLAIGPAGLARADAPATLAAVQSDVTYEKIDTYSVERLNQILSTELDEFMQPTTMPTAFRGKFPPAANAVTLYRVTYRSVIPEQENRPTTASGLLAVPVLDDAAGRALPMVSYQHGTVFRKRSVPSYPEWSAETRIMIARFAAHGYVVVAADYFGRGLSDLPDGYLVKGSTRQATYDMLRAGRTVLAALKIEPGALFLSGWSQGGWATMAFLEKLQEVGEPVTAAAVASAPVDVALTMNRWLNNPQPVDAFFLTGAVALQIQAQEAYHEQSGLAAAAIRPEYLEAARALYEDRMDWDTFAAQTPAKLQDFINPAFRAGGRLGRTPYWRGLDQDQVYRWISATPIHTYYGGKDEVTPHVVAMLPAETQALLGGAPTEAIDAGAEADHRAIFVFGVLEQKTWFDGLLAK